MKALVLAAGKGKRLSSEQFQAPKVLREANGKPLIKYVLDNIDFIPKEDTIIVVGFMKEAVMESVGRNYCYAVQGVQLGTGHAALMAEAYFKNYDGDVVVLYGDMPLFKRKTYKHLIQFHQENKADCTVLTSVYDGELAYGRIIRNQNNEMIDIIEDKDCSPEQKAIKELNVGIYVFKAKKLFENLKLINNDNVQNEYFLTSVPKAMMRNNLKVLTYAIHSNTEILGVNTPQDLALCEKILRGEIDV